MNDFEGIDEVFTEGPEFAPVDLENQSIITSNVVNALGCPMSQRSSVSRLASGRGLDATISAWSDLLIGMMKA